VAVTAITSQELNQRQIADIAAVQRTAPTLNVVPAGDASSFQVALRGQTTQDNVSTLDPAVGIYLDGVYIARAIGGNLRLLDVERVEVLRGPQGTLFGRNTIGGAINITAAKPKDTFEGWVSAGYGNYNAWHVGGMVNVPVNDRIAVRLIDQYNKRDGFAKSTLTGAWLNNEDVNYIRGSVLVKLADSWDLQVSADDTYSDTQGQWLTLIGTSPAGNATIRALSGGTATLDQYINPYGTRLPNQSTGPNISQNWGAAATLTGTIGSVNVKSITSYRRMDRSLTNYDQDQTPYTLFMFDNHSHQHQVSQELQLYGKTLENKLDWIAGGYYFKETGSDFVPQASAYPINPNYNITDGTARNESTSVFGQLTYQVLDSLGVFAGARYTHDKRGITLRNRTGRPNPYVPVACGTPGGVLPTCAVTPPTKSFNYVPFTVGLNYQATTDILAYAKFSRGYRAGGFNLRATSSAALAPFDPERVDTVEIGTKADLWRILRFNAALFHSKFSNAQFNTTQPGPNNVPLLIIANAGEARINGAELEATLVLDRLRLGATLGLLDPKYTKIAPNVVGVNTQSKFQFTSETSYALTADYTLPVSFGDLAFHMDYSWRSAYPSVPVPPGGPLAVVHAYGLLNGTATTHIGEHFEVSVWAKNIADKKYTTRVNDFTASLGFAAAYPGDPQTYGATVKYKF
jgi:iron complex outermembrane receptor protein